MDTPEHPQDSALRGTVSRPHPARVVTLLVAMAVAGASLAHEPMHETPTPAVEASVGIDRLQWLAGCWASARGEPGSGEQWTAPAGGTMLGTSRTILGGRTRRVEFPLLRTPCDPSPPGIASVEATS